MIGMIDANGLSIDKGAIAKQLLTAFGVCLLLALIISIVFTAIIYYIMKWRSNHSSRTAAPKSVDDDGSTKDGDTHTDSE